MSITQRVLSAAPRLALAALLAAVGACREPSGNGEAPTSAPSGVQAIGSSPTSVHIQFAAVEGAEDYEIRRAAAGGSFSRIATTATPWHDDLGLTPGTTYRYQVAARSGGRAGPASSEVSGTTLAAGTKMSLLVGDLSRDRQLTADTAYVIHGWAIVRAPATLRIAAGTQIVGDTLTPGASLVIERGAKIIATGTATSPIVFTSQRAPGARSPGDWGGLAIVGNARTNLRSNAFTQTEGPDGRTVEYSGGADDAHSSGELRYVRLEFGGAKIDGGIYANSLSLYAVGSGTVIDHVQALNGLGDHFRWFGGTVNGRYLVSYDAGDHHFDATEGYRGRNQFMLALQTRLLPRPGGGPTDTPSAFVLQGCEPYIRGCELLDGAPNTMPVFANFTAIGLPPGATSGSAAYNTGVLMVYAGGGTFVNGVFSRIQGRAVTAIDHHTERMIERDSVSFQSVLFAGNAQNFDPEGDISFRFAQARHFADGGNEESSASVAQVAAALPGTLGSGALDWSVPGGSPARAGGRAAFTGALAARAGSFVTPTAYRGAVAPDGAAWWAGWTSAAGR